MARLPQEYSSDSRKQSLHPSKALLTLLQDNRLDLQRVINVHKLLRYALTSSEVAVESEKERLQVYLNHYHQALPLGESLPTTELQPADDLALLAGNTWINLWDLTGDTNYLFSAAAFLEFVVTRSKQSFLSRLLLIRIYRLIGKILYSTHQ